MSMADIHRVVLAVRGTSICTFPSEALPRLVTVFKFWQTERLLKYDNWSSFRWNLFLIFFLLICWNCYIVVWIYSMFNIMNKSFMKKMQCSTCMQIYCLYSYKDKKSLSQNPYQGYCITRDDIYWLVSLN